VNQTFIIAEAGVNHNGDLDRAVEMVEVASRSGADAIKFQTFKTEKIVSALAPKASYQKRNTGDSGSQFDMLKRLELSYEDHSVIAEVSKKNGIEFMSTPFDIDSAAFLVQTIGVERVKVGSGELTNAPLLLELAKSKKPLILSTGMANIYEIENALGVIAYGYTNTFKDPSPNINFKSYLDDKKLKMNLKRNVTLLHCTSDYPALPETINLSAIRTLREGFGLSVGFSDHSEGISIAVAAVALGASVVEKHFTLDRSLPGPDHGASLEPKELDAMVLEIRKVEKAIGSGEKVPVEEEKKTAEVARKSLVAIEKIKTGEIFSKNNLGVKRPGNGVSPFRFWEYLGKKAQRQYEKDEMIQPQ